MHRCILLCLYIIILGFLWLCECPFGKYLVYLSLWTTALTVGVPESGSIFLECSKFIKNMRQYSDFAQQ